MAVPLAVTASGTPIPILGGTRLSGRAGSYDIGMVAMRTEEDDTRPADTFVVGRLRKTFLGTSTVGAIFTSRDSTVAGDFNRLYGVDSRLRFFDRKLDVFGLAAGAGRYREGENSGEEKSAAKPRHVTPREKYDDAGNAARPLAASPAP